MDHVISKNRNIENIGGIQENQTLLKILLEDAENVEQ